MTDERLRDLLRAALPPVSGPEPSRDLWPLVMDRFKAPLAIPWLDIALAAAAAILLMVFPQCILLLVYQL